MEHPPRDVLLRFLLCTASGPENRQVVRHLLARCPSCAVTLRQLWREPPLDPPQGPGAYDSVIDRAVARLQELLRTTVGDAEVDLLRDSVASGRVARRRWLFG